MHSGRVTKRMKFVAIKSQDESAVMRGDTALIGRPANAD